MSSRNSIFLTIDNEHCYTDCNSPIYKDGEYKGDQMCLEIEAKNFTHYLSSDGSISIYLNDPDSEIYKLIKMLEDKEEFLRNNKNTQL